MTDELPIISVNGILGASISPMDRGFAYGDGLFETCQIIAGQIPLWQFHRERLELSCARLMISLNRSHLELYCNQLLEVAVSQGLAEGVMKVIVTRGEGGRGYALPESVSPTICILIYPPSTAPSSAESEGVAVRVCQQRLSPSPVLAGMKHLSRLEQILARAEWQDARWAEGLLLDESHCVIEATVSNMFMLRAGKLLTPDLTRAGVAGVMRRVIIEQLAPALNLPVEITAIMLPELLAADEVFLSNSVRGIWPIVRVDGQESKDFSVGPVTQSLQHELNRFLQKSRRTNGSRI
jgi:4-amino-4-deoxychorismate lyase